MAMIDATPEDHHDDEQRPVDRAEVERHAEEDDADGERDRARPSRRPPIRATPRPSSTTRKSLGLT